MEYKCSVKPADSRKKTGRTPSTKKPAKPTLFIQLLKRFYSDLYDTQPKVAADILKLSEMLRYVTYESENDMVLLTDEIVFLQNYIDLFKRRFDGKVAIVFTHPEDDGHYKIPSLLLIHFLENALKHGITDDYEYPVVLDMKTENERLIFTVGNKYRITKSYDQHGIGNKNINLRLKLMYPEDHKLNIEQDEQYHKVTLTIPFS